MKYKNKKDPKFKSKFEKLAWERLKEAGLEFEYEPTKFVLQPAFQSSVPSMERSRKKFQEVSTSVREITYTPDFVGSNWIIETKGVRTPDFNLKWKLFKSYLTKKRKKWLLFLPQSEKELILSIDTIKRWTTR